VLAVRIGATDLGSVFGLRRPRDLTVYDIRPVADPIADIVNMFGRLGDDGFVVTGPVWEYFSNTERLFKPQLRETPFNLHQERALRADLVAKDLDGLIREVVLDHANGLVGKTVIHPSHVPVVHALSVVTYEEYVDARDIVGAGEAAGVSSSSFRNKMNEANPHWHWAAATLRRAEVFGVSNGDVSFVDLLAACIRV
jgi:citrate lyase beta subunit